MSLTLTSYLSTNLTDNLTRLSSTVTRSEPYIATARFLRDCQIIGDSFFEEPTSTIQQTAETPRILSIFLRTTGMFSTIIAASILIPTAVSFCASVLVGAPIVIATIVLGAIGAGYAIVGHDAWTIGNNVSQALPNPADSISEQRKTQQKSSAPSELPYYLKDTIFLGHAHQAGLLRFSADIEEEFFHVRPEERFLDLESAVIVSIEEALKRADAFPNNALAGIGTVAQTTINYLGPVAIVATRATQSTAKAFNDCVEQARDTLAQQEGCSLQTRLCMRATLELINGATAVSRFFDFFAGTAPDTNEHARACVKEFFVIPKAISTVVCPYLFYKTVLYATGYFMGGDPETLAAMNNATAV